MWRETLRQVGWHGFTGAIYSLAEDPSKHEPGGFAPLWETVDVEPVAAPGMPEGADAGAEETT